MPKVAAIFFDAVGTLLFPEPAFYDVYTEVSVRLGGRQGLEVIRRRFAEAFARQEAIDKDNGWATSEDREHQRWRDIVSEVLDDVTDREAAFQSLYEHFARPDAWRIDPAAERVFVELAKKGAILGLASNYDRRLHQVVAGHPALQRLQRVVISSEVGWRKPAAEFFRQLCATGPFEPSTVLFVGDDYTNDYLGAVQSGLQALLLDPQQRFPRLGANRVTRLEDLILGACEAPPL